MRARLGTTAHFCINPVLTPQVLATSYARLDEIVKASKPIVDLYLGAGIPTPELLFFCITLKPRVE